MYDMYFREQTYIGILYRIVKNTYIHVGLLISLYNFIIYHVVTAEVPTKYPGFYNLTKHRTH